MGRDFSGAGSRRRFAQRLLDEALELVGSENGADATLATSIAASAIATTVEATDYFPLLRSNGVARKITPATLRNYILGISGGIVNIAEAVALGSTLFVTGTLTGAAINGTTLGGTLTTVSQPNVTTMSALSTIGTLVAGTVPAPRISAGAFGTGAYQMGGTLRLIANTDGPAPLYIRRNSASGRAEIGLENEAGTTLWRFGQTGGGIANFNIFDNTNSVNVLGIVQGATPAVTITGNLAVVGTLTTQDILPSANDVRSIGASGNGFVELWISHASSRASGLNLVQTLTGQSSPRLFFNNTTDFAGAANAIYQTASNNLSFTTGGTPGSASGTARWGYNASGIFPANPNAMTLGNASFTWSDVVAVRLTAPTIGTASAVDLVLQRNSVTQLTLGSLTATFAGTLQNNGASTLLSQAAANAQLVVGTSTTTSFSDIRVRAAAGTLRDLNFDSGTNGRWTIRGNSSAESGSNVGTDLVIIGRDDTGTALRTDLVITRSTGAWTIAGAVTMSSLLDVFGNVQSRGDLIHNRSSTTCARSGGASWHDSYFVSTNLLYNHSTAVDAASSWTYINNAGVNNIAGSLLLLRGNATETGVSLQYFTLPTSTGATTVPASLNLRFRVTSAQLTHNGTDAFLAQSATNANLFVGTGTGSSNTSIRALAAAGFSALHESRTASSARWAWGRSSDAEGGADAGSSWGLHAYSDAGAFLNTPISITRAANGTIAFASNRPITGGTYNAQTISATANFTGTVTIATSATITALAGVGNRGIGVNASGQIILLAGGGAGDVVGPASAVDSNLAAFDTATGKLLKDSLIPLANVIVSTGGYSNPAWITALAGSKITGAIDNVTIGATTATTGRFTTIETTTTTLQNVISGGASGAASPSTTFGTIIRGEGQRWALSIEGQDPGGGPAARFYNPNTGFSAFFGLNSSLEFAIGELSSAITGTTTWARFSPTVATLVGGITMAGALAGATTGAFSSNVTITGTLASGRAAVGGASLSTSAALVLPAGTTAVAPLRMPTGVAPTTPVDGDIWLDATGRYFRRYGGATATIGSATLSVSAGGDMVAGFIWATSGTPGETVNSSALVIANDRVTYAKMQNVSAASRLLGRGSAAGAGDPEEITIGTGLAMTATTLSATYTWPGVAVRKNSGVNVGTRTRLNFIEGSNVTLSVLDDLANDEVDITISSTGGGGGGGGTSGTGLISFGSGATDATLVVTGQASIVAGSRIECWIEATASADHNIDEHVVADFWVRAGNISAGVGFTIYAVSMSKLQTGSYTIGWRWT